MILLKNKNPKGISLIEVVISLCVLGIIGAGFLTAIRGSTVSLIQHDRRTVAESLIRSQWEYVKDQNYSDNFSYDMITPIDPSFTVIMKTDNQTIDHSMQIMTYEVLYKGQEMISLTDSKIRR